VPPIVAALLLSCAEPGLPQPEPPLGPDSLRARAPGTFLFYNQPDDIARIRYCVDWGDLSAETTSALRLGDTVTVEHSWQDAGDFSLRCRAIADTGDRQASAWSDPKIVSVVNSAPLTPAAPSGPETLRVDTTGEFRARTTDPEADLIDYLFDWGNGESSTAGGYASGDTARVLYSWNAAGEYAVRVRARDAHGRESGWSPARYIVILP
jgi:hypothetical protein